MKNQRLTMPKMRKLVIREVETVKTTAAVYSCGCPGLPPCWPWEE